VANDNDTPKKNLGESIRQRLRNLSKERNRPFDETLRYYAMERFLYRLGISSYMSRFFLKGGLMLKVWDSIAHRATMDIDLLARTSNKLDNLRQIITEVSAIQADDAIVFDCQKLNLRETQTGGDYEGVSVSFSSQLSSTRIPILIDIGFNDIVIPEPQEILYPTLLPMPAPSLMGYTPETVVAEKLETAVKLGLVNTRMKDFYDLWTICKTGHLNPKKLERAIKEVFANRSTRLEYPIAFTSAFYDAPETKQRWKNFQATLGKNSVDFREVISEISMSLGPLIVNL
jgi:hypothetical protein